MLSPIPVQPLCLFGMLAAVGFGFFVGTGTSFASRGERGNAVMAARYYPRSAPTSIPQLPRSMFFACLFLAFFLTRGLCPELKLLMILVAACAISSGAWLIVAYNFQKAVDQERKLRIAEFNADPENPVPPPVPGLEAAPPRLKLWHQFNVASFLLVMAALVLTVRPAP